jgi:hypothetical protein
MSSAVMKKIKRMYEKYDMRVEPYGNTFRLSVFTENSHRVRTGMFSLYIELALGTLGFKCNKTTDGYVESFVIPEDQLTPARRRALDQLVNSPAILLTTP